MQLILTRSTHRQSPKHYIKGLLDIVIWKTIYILIINPNPSKNIICHLFRGKLMVLWTCPTLKQLYNHLIVKLVDKIIVHAWHSFHLIFFSLFKVLQSSHAAHFKLNITYFDGIFVISHNKEFAKMYKNWSFQSTQCAFNQAKNLVMSKCVLKPLGYWGHYNPLGIKKEFNHVSSNVHFIKFL